MTQHRLRVRNVAVATALLTLPSVAHAATHRVLYAFHGGTDGAYPLAGVTAFGSALYGTTSGGGKAGLGTVFVLNTGTETVLHAFSGRPDGSTPSAGLAVMNGTLYGTTFLGGASTNCSNGCGTVFSVKPGSGAVATVYAFQGEYLSGDGSFPLASLLPLNGVLYGTTSASGTLFSISPEAGAIVLEQTLGFGGAYPQAALINVNGILYSTANNGGSYNKCSSGCGTVYSWNPGFGTPTTIYQFQDSPDGLNPKAGLAYLGGALYGTTFSGGASGRGAVFAIDLATGTERILYSFRGGPDGAYPTAGLTLRGGKFFGTTSQGGNSATCSAVGGCGTIFSIDPASGTEQLIYTFAGGADGQTPQAGLLNLNNVLYGTTIHGGLQPHCSNNGCGTIFSLTP